MLYREFLFPYSISLGYVGPHIFMKVHIFVNNPKTNIWPHHRGKNTSDVTYNNPIDGIQIYYSFFLSINNNGTWIYMNDK